MHSVQAQEGSFGPQPWGGAEIRVEGPSTPIPPAESVAQPRRRPVDVEALLDRLEAAESRIADLEHQLRKRNAPDATQQPPVLETPPFAGPALSRSSRRILRQDERDEQRGTSKQSDEAPNDEAERVTKPSKRDQKQGGDGSDGADGEGDDEDEQDPSRSQVEEFSKRLAEIEKEWGEFHENVSEKAAEAAKRPTVDLGGRIHLDYWAFPKASDGIGYFEHPDPLDEAFGTDPEDRFVFRRIRLELEGEILEQGVWRIQVDFNNPGTPEYKDVYLGFQNLPGNQTLLIGNQKRPLGLDRLNSSRFNVFMERPLVVEAFNEDARRLGIAMYGYTEDERYNWTYGVYNLENTSTDGRYIGDSLQLSANARLSSSPWYDETSGGRGYFHWGIAGMLARPDGDAFDSDTNENEARFRTRPELRSDSRWIDTGPIPGAQWYEIVGVESILNLGAFQLCGEYQSSWVQRDSTIAGTGPDLNFHGGYIYVSWFLTGEHVPYDRQSGMLDRVIPFENFFLVDRCRGGIGHGWGAWQVALRYSYLDLTDNDIEGGLENNVTAALNWHWTPYSKVQFNTTYGDIRARERIGGYESGHFVGFGTRFMVDF